MANKKFTDLPTVVNSTINDIICAVQSDDSVQQTLAQVGALFLANTILNYAGDPNGNIAGTTYQLCWDTTNLIMYVCTTAGNPVTAVWTTAGSVTFPIPLSQGGTAANLTASNGGIFYSTASAGAILAGTATAGKILQSGANAAPNWSAITYPGSGANSGQVLASNGTNIAYTSISYPITGGSTGNILRFNGTNIVYSTATFADTYSASSLLYSNGANTISGLATANSASLVTNSSGVPLWTSSMTNGQVVIGNTSGTPTVAALTSGIGISISNGAGSITIATTGIPLFSWTNSITTNTSMVTNNGYILTNSGSITMSLPTTSAVGDKLIILGNGSSTWIIGQAAGQSIKLGSVSTTVGVGGTLTAAAATDSIELFCTVANTTWKALSIESSGFTYV